VSSIERTLALGFAIALTPALAACGGSDSGDQAPTPLSTDTAWETLISGEWTRPVGTEGYTCVRRTVEEDLFVKAFEAINPLGTHHTLLTMGEPDGPDGITLCNAGENRMFSAFGSGVGTDPLEFPPGVAMKIPRGTQLLLNLHLFATTTDLSGISGTRVRTVPESEVDHLAEGILAGTTQIDIAPLETKTSIGWCTMSSDVTLFAVAPHMHQLGVYEKVVAEKATGEVTLFDGPYDFDEQSYQSIEPLELARGERVRVECTHKNTTDKRVLIGESTLSEMCFAGLYRYPADGSIFICVDRIP
jgi:hypothetical protein